MASDSGSITYKPYRHWPGPDQEPFDLASIFRPDIWEAARAWQAFRDWLDGNSYQWYARGFDDGHHYRVSGERRLR